MFILKIINSGPNSGSGGVDSFLCSVLYINDCPFSFGHCIACPQVALGDLQTLALYWSKSENVILHG